MNTYVTHPSVRIKGTENNMSPLRCVDQRCGDTTMHMHCPFCVKTDLYHDPVILKAHYRVKHVDKGIDFAGLKILRCCDHCDIVGIIKGEKKFKGAHWHCYKCRNGFNRRDEAIKHYKTHFRNPQTTFQIQIAQEVYASKYDDATPSAIETTSMSIHPALTEAVMSTTVSQELAVTQPTHITLPNGKSTEVHTSVAAEETVDTAQTHHIMIIHEDPMDGASTYTTQVISGEDVNLEEEKERAEDQNIDNNQFEDLQQKYKKLQVEKLLSEQTMKAEISELQTQVMELRNEVANYQKREQEYIEQLSVPLDKNIENILKQMENQHRSLLHQHLLNLKREYKPVPLVLNNMSTENIQYLPQGNLTEVSEVSQTTAELGQEVSPTTSLCSSDNVSSSNLDMPASISLEDNIAEKLCNDEVSGQKVDKIRLESTGAGDSGDPFVVCIQYQNDSKCNSVMVDLPEDGGDIMEEPIAKRMKTS